MSRINFLLPCDDLDHLGTEKSAQVILENYGFLKLWERVDCHIKNCLKCIMFPPVSGKVKDLIHSITEGNVPFGTLHVDHLGLIDKITAKKTVR